MRLLRFSTVLLAIAAGTSALPAPSTPDPPASNAALDERDADHGPAADAHGSPASAARPPGKYFYEAGLSLELGHYDARFFHGEVSYDEHRAVLRHLIRSYLQAFGDLRLETWLAHGTLLGWWWNGQIMPWDYDVDVQVSAATMAHLARHLNGTTHSYSFLPGPDDLFPEHEEHDTLPSEDAGDDKVDDAREDDAAPPPQTATRRYLLDVNPHFSEPRGNGLNIIDARWIDVSNGMFIDITALAERNPQRRPGVWSCKNYHNYDTRDLYPMRRTQFEGVPATVPYSFEKVLTQEYGTKSLVTTAWKGHRWEPELKEWVKLGQKPIKGT